MSAINERRFPSFFLAWSVLWLGCVVQHSYAESFAPQIKSEAAPAAQEPESQTQPKDEPAKGTAADGAKPSRPAFDPAVVSAGMAAFERSCLKCHDAARSLERTKDLAGWRATVRRMAAKRGAEIASNDIEPISVYLASRTAGAAAATAETGAAAGATTSSGTAGAAAASGDASSLAAFATFSPLWRGGNNHVQNPDFAPLTWVGASWQGKTLSGRATLCITCHGVQETGMTSRVEPVEAAVRLDVSQFLDHYCHGMKGSIDAGRFVVPFGAFSAQVDPSVYRTVSTPLIFNMGQRVFNSDLGVPVLPMPFANQGADLNLVVPLGDCGTGPITATTDGYLINGLVGGSTGVDFLRSRDLLDNNNRVAGGGRITVSDPNIRAGASLTGGRLDDPNTSGVPGALYYRIYGFDLQARYKRLFRCQAEYARRENDRFGTLAAGPTIFSESVSGCYVEVEARPWNKCRVSFLTRYDFQRNSSPLPPPGSTLTTGNFDVQRVTFGANIDLWHQSLLMVNYERWILPVPNHPTADVFGVRYTITF